MDPQAPPYAEHQRFIATLRARVHGQTLALRLATLAGVSTWLLVHGQSPEARYLFVAPLLALAGGALEVGLARRDQLLGALARVPTAMVDLELVALQVPRRRALLRSALAWLYVPTAVLAAGITIDTLAARPGWEGQTIWMVALALSVIAAYAGLLGAWWLERFGEPAAVKVGAAQLRIAAGVGTEAPRSETAFGGAHAGGAGVQRTPSLAPPEPSPGPFPVKRTEATTQSFGTPLT
jgi:hypothetical protein